MKNLYHVDWTKTFPEAVPYLRFWTTDDQGRRLPPILVPVEGDLRPSFFIDEEHIPTLSGPTFEIESDIYMAYNGKKARRIVMDSPDNIQDLRNLVGIQNTFEADVPFARRIMIDKNITLDIPTRYVHIDIEVDPSEGMPDEATAERRILSIAAKENSGTERFFCDDNEQTMIAQFLLYLDTFSVVCTFNGNHFDWPYLMNRCKRLGIDYWWDVHVHVDLLAMYKYVLQKRQDQYSLAHIAKEEKLKAQKMDIDTKKLLLYFQNDRKTLEEYNTGDVRVMHELDKKLDMVGIVFNIGAVTNTNVKDLVRVFDQSYKEFNTSIAVDGLVLSLSAKRPKRIVWKSREFRPSKLCLQCQAEIENGISVCPACGYDYTKKRYSGALVITPVPGVHKDVVMLDVNSLYPTIIQSFNMGPETFRSDNSGTIQSPIGRGSFTSDTKSVFSEALEKVLTIRREYKRQMKALDPSTVEWKAAYSMDYAYKVLANSMYGVLGSSFSRYYSKDIAENITLTGQATLGFLRDELGRIGMQVILGDTDSVAFVMPDMDTEKAGTLADTLTTRAADHLEKLSGVRPTLLRLDIDRLCSSMFIPGTEEKATKKRYAAFVTWQGVPTFYVMMKGLEAVRHDSSEAQKDFQLQGLMLVLSDSPPEAKKAFVESWKAKLYGGTLIDKVTIRKGLGKDPKTYKVMTPALRVGRMLEAQGKLVLHRGDKIAYIKVGPKSDEVMPVLPGEPPVLTREHYAYIFDSQFRMLANRLGIETAQEVVKVPRKRRVEPLNTADV
jgi:DNA polymerase I